MNLQIYHRKLAYLSNRYQLTMVISDISEEIFVYIIYCSMVILLEIVLNWRPIKFFGNILL